MDGPSVEDAIMYSPATAYDIDQFWLKGREKTIANLFRALNAGQNCVLVGVPGVGKTWIRRYVSDPNYSPKTVTDPTVGQDVEFRSAQGTFLLFDCITIGTLQRFWSVFLAELHGSGIALGKNDGMVAPPVNLKQPSFQDVEDRLRAFRHRDLGFVCLFDHWDDLVRKLTERERRTLKLQLASLHGQGSIRYVFFTTPRFASEAQGTPIGELLGQEILVGLPEEQYLQQVISQHGHSVETSDRILQNTGGNPRLTLLLLSQLVLASSQTRKINWDVSRSVVPRGLLKYEASFRSLSSEMRESIVDVWWSLNEDEQNQLYEVVAGGATVVPLAGSHEDTQARGALLQNRLMSLGLLKRGGNRVAGDYFELYISENYLPWWKYQVPAPPLAPRSRGLIGLFKNWTLWAIIGMIATILVGMNTGEFLLVLVFLFIDAFFVVQMIRSVSPR